LYLKTAVVYLLAVTVCLLTLFAVLKLWQADMSVPFIHPFAGDGLFFATLVKGIFDNGWYLNNDFLGAPAGFNLLDFPLADNLHLIVIKGISLFSSNWALAMNLFYLATFPLTVISCLFVFRRFLISYPVAMTGSLLFAFLPYHFERGEIHLFLSGIYVIPLSALVFLRICDGVAPFIRMSQKGEEFYDFWNLKSAGYILIGLLTASAGIYYAFFAFFFTGIAGIYSVYVHKSVMRLSVAGVMIAIIGVGVVINISPTIIHQQIHGKNEEVAQRKPAEAMSLGMVMTSLILPTYDHRMGPLGDVKANAVQDAGSAASTSSLGLIGSVGFLFLLGWLLLAKKRYLGKENSFATLIDALSVMNISAILLSVISGFGLLVALYISPQIRAYHRMNIYIGFFSILAVLLVVEYLRRKYVKPGWRSMLYFGALGALLVGGILDQTNAGMVPDYAATGLSFDRDEAFIRRIEQTLPQDALVFQLPYMPFNESPPVNEMRDYDHFRGYLHSKNIHWSYGAMRGREGDDWLKKISSEPVDQMVTELAAAGFSGIYVNRKGYVDEAAEIEKLLENGLGVKPLVSDDNTLLFFNMTNFVSVRGPNVSNRDGDIR
jgi:phosphoglycerol transferase